VLLSPHKESLGYSLIQEWGYLRSGPLDSLPTTETSVISVAAKWVALECLLRGGEIKVLISRFSWFVLALVCILVLLGAANELSAQQQTQSSYRLQTAVMGSAGSPGATGAKRSNGTMGQPTPTGVGSASDKVLYAGFWSRPWVLASIFDDGGLEVFKNCLFHNYPNPFCRSTTIAYTVEREAAIEIAVFNVQGRKVRTLVSGQAFPGRHTITFDGTDDRGHRVSPGVYFYRLTIGDWRSAKKMIVLD
jgi:hypothetical protein